MTALTMQMIRRFASMCVPFLGTMLHLRRPAATGVRRDALAAATRPGMMHT
jgi:hypothetical protein